MPTLEEIMRMGAVPQAQPAPVSNRQKWANSLSDLGLGFLSSGSESFGKPLARGIQMKRDRKQQAKDEARDIANEQFKRGLGIADLDMQTKRYDAKIAAAKRPGWKVAERYNPETGRKEKVMYDQYGNIKPFGGQAAETGSLYKIDGPDGPVYGDREDALGNRAYVKPGTTLYGNDGNLIAVIDGGSPGAITKPMLNKARQQYDAGISVMELGDRMLSVLPDANTGLAGDAVTLGQGIVSQLEQISGLGMDSLDNYARQYGRENPDLAPIFEKARATNQLEYLGTVMAYQQAKAVGDPRVSDTDLRINMKALGVGGWAANPASIRARIEEAMRMSERGVARNAGMLRIPYQPRFSEDAEKEDPLGLR